MFPFRGVPTFQNYFFLQFGKRNPLQRYSFWVNHASKIVQKMTEICYFCGRITLHIAHSCRGCISMYRCWGGRYRRHRRQRSCRRLGPRRTTICLVWHRNSRFQTK